MAAKKRVIVAVLSNGAYGREAAQGIYDYAAKHGHWEIQFDGASNYPGSIRRLRRMIKDWRPQGIIGQIMFGALPAVIRSSGILAVSLSRTSKPIFPTVTWDCEAAGRLGARYFAEQNMPHFAYAGRLAVREDPCAQSFAAELQALRRQCQLFSPSSVLWEDTDYARMRAWLRKLPKPIGIMASDDHRGREIIEACTSLQFKVPDDVAVMGVVNDPMVCSLCPPFLSSVSVPSRTIGFEAAHLLDRLLRGQRVTEQMVERPPLGIVARQSSDIVAVTDPDLSAALKFIREHACDAINVSDVVTKLALSRRSLERRFIEELGRTPRQEIMRTRLSRAKMLLLDSSLKIADVSRSCGFGAHIKFPRIFRRYVGQSPSAYRADHQRPGACCT